MKYTTATATVATVATIATSTAIIATAHAVGME